MRTRTETVAIPQKSFQKAIFGCDACSFESESQEAVAEHHASKHAVKDTKKIDDITFFLFKTREDFEIYKSVKYSGDPQSGDWRASGWYGRFYHTAPCGRGCCSREWYELRFADECISGWQSQIDDIQYKINALNELQKGPA